MAAKKSDPWLHRCFWTFLCTPSLQSGKQGTYDHMCVEEKAGCGHFLYPVPLQKKEKKDREWKEGRERQEEQGRKIEKEQRKERGGGRKRLRRKEEVGGSKETKE